MKDPVLAQALTALDAADVAASDDAGCADLLGAIRRVRGWVDAMEARVTSRMRDLHATSGAAPAADRHTRCGGVSAAEGRRKERRAEAIDQAPSFGAALADGAIGAEHVDALANATAQLRTVHELGWRLDLASDRTLTVTDRDGAVVVVSGSGRPTRPGASPLGETKGGGVMRAPEPFVVLPPRHTRAPVGRRTAPAYDRRS